MDWTKTFNIFLDTIIPSLAQTFFNICLVSSPSSVSIIYVKNVQFKASHVLNQ